MICPECNNQSTRCVDSRQRGPTRWRRYHCQCGYRFSTDEAIIGSKTDPVAPAPPDLTTHIDAIEVLTGTITEAIAAFRRANPNG